MNFKLLFALAVACVAFDGATANRAHVATHAHQHMRGAAPRDMTCFRSCIATLSDCVRTREVKPTVCMTTMRSCQAAC